jgi:hypothetical protein
VGALLGASLAASILIANPAAASARGPVWTATRWWAAYRSGHNAEARRLETRNFVGPGHSIKQTDPVRFWCDNFRGRMQCSTGVNDYGSYVLDLLEKRTPTGWRVSYARIESGD